MTATHSAPRSPAATNTDWWRGGVIYQIYPRSFQDSNGDGIGDLAGIIHRLQYLADLGVDAIWVSPFFRSPMLDFGYDVSDYRDVDPIFGTLGDFDALVDRAHELGLRVIIDLVMSHTSMDHDWFKESRSSRDNAKCDWYVWADPKPDGTPPNNWLSIFGGPAWQWDGERMQYYLHNFLAEQPDLNFHNPDVQKEMLATIRYWLERGVDGFRLDTVNFYFHDRQLRDNPPLPEEDRNENTAPKVNPYNFQDHVYDKTQPENLEFLRRVRAVLNEYPGATAVGEVGESQRGMQVQAEYTAGDDRLHMCYDFAFLANTFPSGPRIADVLEKFNRTVTEGWACWAFSNHDVVRHATRWNLDPDMQRLYAGLLMSLKGSICLYQGEELGLAEAYVAHDDLQDPYGKRFWPKFKGRDGARTPFPWSSEMSNGGFSDAKPWLPVAVEHVRQAADRQEADPQSMLHFYRNMLGFRKRHPAILKGDIDLLSADDAQIAFIRRFQGESVFCQFNLSQAPLAVTLPEGDFQIAPRAPFKFENTVDGIRLPAYQAVFAASADRSA